MDKRSFEFEPNDLGGIDIPENNPFETDMSIFGGMTQDEIEAEADREEAEGDYR